MTASNPSLLFFEVRTIICIMSGIALLLAGTHLYAWMLRRRDYWLAFWGFGNFLAAIGLALVSLRGYAPYFVTISISQTAIVAGLFLNWLGLRAFNERPTIGAWWWLLFPALVGLLEIASPISDTMTHRMTLISSLLSLIAIMMIFELAAICKVRGLQVTRFIMALFGLFIAGNIARTIMMWVHPLHHLSGLPSPIVGCTLALTLALMTAWNMGFLMLAAERLQNALIQAASTDGLTGVMNRNAFEAAVRRQLAPNQKFNSRPMSSVPATGERGRGMLCDALLTIDIDEFKQVNDQFGHEAGDALLRMFAASAQNSLRSTDCLGRRGGDEFTIFLKGVDEAGAARIAERLRRSFTHSSQHDPQIGRPSTLSIGVMMIHGSAASLETLLAQADAALYKAKGQGKDRVMMATSTAQFAT